MQISFGYGMFTGALGLHYGLEKIGATVVPNSSGNTGKSADVLHIRDDGNQETQVILFYSASGGTGKTTAAIGVSASLAKNYKKVLYINAARLQIFQHMLENYSAITAADVYAKLASASDEIYPEIRHVIRRELFSYLPPFKAALMSLGLSYSV